MSTLRELYERRADMIRDRDARIAELEAENHALKWGPERIGHAVGRDLLADAQARIAELEAEVARLRMVIERDRSIVAMTLTEIRKAIGGRQWLSEGGRGSYAYDDEDYQKEFGEALDEIAAAMQPLRRLAADWQNCPTDPLDITIARKGLRESFRAALRTPTGGDDRE